MKRGDYQEAQEQLVKAKEAMAGVTDARTQAELDANFAYVDGVLLQKKKDYPAALSSLELAQKKFHELNDRDRAVKCYGVIGDIYLAQKSLSAAKDSYRSGLSVAQQVSRKDAEMKCLDGLGKTALAEALPLEAKKFFEAAAKLATQLGDLDRASDLTRRAATLRG
jgi:tetratricopeptide (TPR) repeat protein